MAILTSFLHPTTWRFSAPAPRANNDYATHIPVLVGLARWKPIRSVLELGSGLYSTPTFLNRKSFPDLEVLDSFDTDNTWVDSVTALISGDTRASINVVPGEMAAAVGNLLVDHYDLIFVDDSRDAEDRARTITALCERNPRNSIVVIHDFEVARYRDVARGFRHRYAFRAFNPETGVAWQNGLAKPEAFKRIDAVIRQHASLIKPDDLERWVEAFS